jgi:hypothetical protein
VTEVQRDALHKPRAPICIIGSPRSGTSVLVWSLAQHSQLWASSESDNLYALYGPNEVRRIYERAMHVREAGFERRMLHERSSLATWARVSIRSLAVEVARSNGSIKPRSIP